MIPFVASLLIVVVVSTAFYGLVRFRLPYDLASCLLGGVVVAAALDRYGPRRPTDRPRRTERASARRAEPAHWARLPLTVTIAIDSAMICADIFDCRRPGRRT